MKDSTTVPPRRSPSSAEASSGHVLDCVDLNALVKVTGAGRKDAAFCQQMRDAGMQFGNRVAGGKVADVLPRLFDPEKPKLANDAIGVVAPFAEGQVRSGVEAKMPSFCRR